MPLARRRTTVLTLMLAAGLAWPLSTLAGDPASGSGTTMTASRAPGGGAAPTLPAPTERCVRAFLAMWNDPTPAKVEAFDAEFSSADRRKRATPAERSKSLGEMLGEQGAATLRNVIAVGPTVATVAVDMARAEPAAFEFQFSETEPGRLDAVMISPLSHGEASGPIDGAARAALVESAAKALEERYVFPEVGAKMAALARENLKKGAYDACTDEASFNRKLTSDFRSVSNDKHLGVRLAPKRDTEAPLAGAGPSMDEMKARNYGFVKAETLPGGVGYLRFDVFLDSPEAKETAAAALAFLKNSRALVVDLRQNGGGSPEMIRYITTSLFASRTHLNDMVDRDGKVVEEYWTLEPGEGGPETKFADDLPVFVLTSGRTFSGAEEFSYNLQNLKRATIVGETTGGGAHPVDGVRLSDRAIIRVPYMRAQNPISKTNWEGTGVKPDVAVPADQALEKALELAKAKIGK